MPDVGNCLVLKANNLTALDTLLRKSRFVRSLSSHRLPCDPRRERIPSSKMKALSNPSSPFVFDITSPHPVLLVDDDDDAILLIQLLLKRAKVTSPINITTDGEQAISYFQSRLQDPTAKRPLVVFLDLKLPRRNGFEVLKWIRSQPSLNDLPIVIMSSSNRPLDMENARLLGADFYCEKYPALEDLIALFEGKTFFPPLPTLDFG